MTKEEVFNILNCRDDEIKRHTAEAIIAGFAELTDDLRSYFHELNELPYFWWDSRLKGNESAILLKVFSLYEEDQKFSVSDIQKFCPLGQTALRIALKRLEQYGYAIKEQIKNKAVYHFYRSPKLNPTSVNENQEGGAKS